MFRKRRNKRQEDEEAEFGRLMEDAAAEKDTQRRDALGVSLLLKAAEWAEKRKPTPQDAIRPEYQAAADREDWTAAEDACRRLIALSDSPAEAWRNWRQLVNVLSEQGNHIEAFAAAQSATAAARETDLTPLIIMALRDEVAQAIRLGERAHAYACVNEGINLVAQNEDLRDLSAWQHAAFLVHRAEMQLADGEIDAAMADLKAAEPALQPYASSMMAAGPLSALRYWWQVSAQIHLRQEDFLGAQQASQESLWIARRIAEIPQLAEGDRRRQLARSLEKFAEVQGQLGDAAAAETARQEAIVLRAVPRSTPEE